MTDLGLDTKDERVFISDEILKKEGFMKFWSFILENKITEIDIIGGSHSGFSVAWMLLNGSAMFDFGYEHLGELPQTEKFKSDLFYIGENYEYDNWKIEPL